MTRAAIPFLAILLTGCGAPPAYRYADRVLIPPGVKSADIPSRAITLSFRATCESSDDAITLQPAGQSVRVAVQRAALRGKPSGWLARWAESLAQKGCIASEDAPKLAAQIAEAIPLEPRVAFSLLHPPEIAYVDIEPGTRLSAVGPIFREGTAAGARAVESAEINGLNITVKSSPDLIGVETAWYSIDLRKDDPRKDGPGVRVAFLSADDRIGDQTTHPPQPRLDYLHLPPEAAYLRLFTITRRSSSNHDMLLLSAATQSQLNEATIRVEADPASCANLSPFCIEVPADSVLARVPLVTANNAVIPIQGNGTLRAVLQSAGVAQPATILPTLQIKRPYLGRLTPLTFDRTQQSILDLPLSGGEVLRW